MKQISRNMEWAYATGIVNINTSGNYTIGQIKEMYEKNYGHLVAVLDAQKGGINGTKPQGQSALARVIGVSQGSVGDYMDFFKVSKELQQALVMFYDQLYSVALGITLELLAPPSALRLIERLFHLWILEFALASLVSPIALNVRSLSHFLEKQTPLRA
jgi:hypothetical protein